MRYFDRAALFVEACLKYGAFEVSEDTDILCKDIYAKGEESDIIEIWNLSWLCCKTETYYIEKSSSCISPEPGEKEKWKDK